MRYYVFHLGRFPYRLSRVTFGCCGLERNDQVCSFRGRYMESIGETTQEGAVLSMLRDLCCLLQASILSQYSVVPVLHTQSVTREQLCRSTTVCGCVSFLDSLSPFHHPPWSIQDGSLLLLYLSNHERTRDQPKHFFLSTDNIKL